MPLTQEAATGSRRDDDDAEDLLAGEGENVVGDTNVEDALEGGTVGADADAGDALGDCVNGGMLFFKHPPLTDSRNSGDGSDASEGGTARVDTDAGDALGDCVNGGMLFFKHPSLTDSRNSGDCFGREGADEEERTGRDAQFERQTAAACLASSRTRASSMVTRKR